MGKLILSMLCIALINAAAIAESVYVPLGQQAAEKQTLPRPQLGMTKTQVQQQFGEPRDWRDAVGNPPISSWVYDDFTVYFEYEYVIHSVLTSAANPQPVN